MSSWSEGRRPITLAILALGGEGGGVLADWIVAVAEGAGHSAQNTSVAGVAQRTGATVYYVEIFPPIAGGRPAESVRSEPVMAIFPTPGQVDIVIASELMEAGRAIQRGFATPDRTTLITSTGRVYSIDEKMALGDGRVDKGKLLEAAGGASRRLIAADFAALAQASDSVTSASLFGALAGSGALPFTREEFEAPIRAFGKAVEQSLAAFDAGFLAAAQPASLASDGAELGHDGGANGQTSAILPIIGPGSGAGASSAGKAADEALRSAVAASDPASLVGPDLRWLAERTLGLPASARSMMLHGLVRTALYQDLSYAELYLNRVAQVASVDPESDTAARMTRAAARHVALWMCYQDTIQVALQKTRRSRMSRIRKEARAKDDQLLQVHEFLHPQIDEITDTLPRAIGAVLRESKWSGALVHRVTHRGMILNTTSVVGYTLLTTMARARPLRPRSLRFSREQAAIEQWLGDALQTAVSDPDLAREMIECQEVLKGYGATWAHGEDSFAKLMRAARDLRGGEDAAARLAELRSAAFADENGRRLEEKLSQYAVA